MSQIPAVVQQPFPMEAPSQPINNVDLLQLAWRWKWLTILGLLLGSGIGFLVFKRQPEEYTAIATIQVVSPQDNLLPLQNIESGFAGGVSNRSDEIRVITSSRVLESAVKKGNLGRNAALAGKSEAEILDWIRSGKKLSVTPGTKETTTEILDVAFKCGDANLASEVVKAIVLGYDDFISRETQTFGREVIDQVGKAKIEFDRRFKTLNDEYMVFRKESELVFVGSDEGRDPYADTVLAINNQLSANRIKITRLESALQHVQEGIAASRNAESLLLMLARTVFSDEYNFRADRENAARNPALVKNRASEAERLRRQELVPLQMKESSLLASGSGESHPQIKDLRIRITMMQELISQIENQEKQDDEELTASMAELNISPITPEDRLKVVVESIQEELFALKLEETKLLAIASENREKSREQQQALAKSKIFDQELKTAGSFLQSLDTAISKFNLAPEYGRKTMHSLELPDSGGLTGPFWPKYVLLGAFVGGALFFGISYLLELADRSFRSPEEITSELGLPIYGHVPIADVRVSDRKDEKVDLSIVSVHRSKSSQSEAFRGVRTAIYFNNRSGNIKVLQVTSPVPGDGKSTLAANLAVTMAQSGRRVLLMDCDFRRPRVSKLFGMRDEIGITSVIAGKAELIDVVQTSSIENLSILACGKKPANPAELLSSARFDELLQVIREKYDFVVIDTPPLLAVSDPANVAARVDGVLLCLRLRRNLKPLAGRATQMLQSLNANVLGVVVNGVGGRGGYGYGGYRYGSGYGYGYGYRYGGYGQYGGQAYGGGYGAHGYGGGYGSDYGVKEYYDDDRKVTGRRRRGIANSPNLIEADSDQQNS